MAAACEEPGHSDAAFHGYEPLRIVDDVINSFNDCAPPRLAQPLAFQAASLLARSPAR